MLKIIESRVWKIAKEGWNNLQFCGCYNQSDRDPSTKNEMVVRRQESKASTQQLKQNQLVLLTTKRKAKQVELRSESNAHEEL